MNGNYNISRCNNMQGISIYSLHIAMCALIRGGREGGRESCQNSPAAEKLRMRSATSCTPPSHPHNVLTKEIKFMSSPDTGTVINYGSGSDFLTNYGSGYVPGSTSLKLPVPVPVPVPVPQHWHRQ